MGITEKQLERRRSHIGSSDVAAILGVDPWRTPYDVWLEKTGKVLDLQETDAMKAGRLFEDGLLQFASEELGGKIVRNQYRSLPGSILGANVDAILIDKNEPIEAKMTSAHSKEEWGNAGTDDVPDRVIVQCNTHMACMAAPAPQVCYHPHYDAWKGLGLYFIPRNQELIDLIREKSEAFWSENVQKDIPPDGQASLSMATRMIRVIDKTTDLTDDLKSAIVKWNQFKAAKSKLDKAVDARKALVLSMLGDAEASIPVPGWGQVTYLEQSKSGVDSKKLKEEHPDVAEAVKKTSTYRVLRFKKIKEKKEKKAKK